MADRKKVINALGRCESYGYCEDKRCPYYEGTSCLESMRKDALELLKEQEAKPVIVTTNAYGTRFYHCPKCNRDLYAYPRQLYCSNCGQAVKWDATD